MSAKILIADDEEFIVDLLATLLEDEGFTVLRAYDGAQALAIAERERPDLILSDVMMPLPWLPCSSGRESWHSQVETARDQARMSRVARTTGEAVIELRGIRFQQARGRGHGLRRVS